MIKIKIIGLQNPLYDTWVLPVIQGFVQIENCKVEMGCDFMGNDNYVSKHEVSFDEISFMLY